MMGPADDLHGGGLLPSYRDATAPRDWLALVAPYVPSADLARLCCVSRRFYHQFAPRLWNDPFGVICKPARYHG